MQYWAALTYVYALSQAIQADNGSFLYYLPGNHPGYSSYSTFFPGAMVGVDGQCLGQLPYYPTPLIPQPLVSPGPFPQPGTYGPELVPAYPWDPSLLFPGVIQAYSINGDQSNPSKPNFSSQSHTLAHSKASPTSMSASETKGSSPVSDVSLKQGQPLRPVNKVMHFIRL